MNAPLINKQSFIFAGIVLILCLLLFFNDSKAFAWSLSAAILTAALAWLAFVVMRLLILTFKK